MCCCSLKCISASPPQTVTIQFSQWGEADEHGRDKKITGSWQSNLQEQIKQRDLKSMNAYNIFTRVICMQICQQAFIISSNSEQKSHWLSHIKTHVLIFTSIDSIDFFFLCFSVSLHFPQCALIAQIEIDSLFITVQAGSLGG